MLKRIIHTLALVLLNFRNRHFFAIDLAIFCLTPWIALLSRLDSADAKPLLSQSFNGLALYVLVAIILRWAVFIPLGLYTRYWRYASIDEAGQITLAVAASTILMSLVFWGILQPLRIFVGGFPRSLPLIDGLLILFLVGGVRFSVRLADRLIKRAGHQAFENAKRVVVIGAGDAGTMIVREMQSNPHLGLLPVAFLDSDPSKHSTVIHGVPVIGDRRQLSMVMEDYKVTQAIIAMPTAAGKTIREITRLCHELELPVKTVPGVFELLDGSVTVNQLRQVEIGDLLRREPIVTDTAEITHELHGKCVLVTGAGGSIGSELCRQIARCQPSALVLLGHGEHSIFGISNELRQLYPTLKIRSVIADVRDAPRLQAIFRRYQPQWVLHTAAHKHVPLMEENVEDAITNNVLGTDNLVRESVANNVERFIFISSDKAVNPSSVMGATKRVAELIVQSAAQHTGRVYVAVRFGNVLGSRGSVIPFFKEQIARGGPVTVTHPQVTRYFMMIPEAVQLVLQSAMLGKGGEIFVLDMGEPIKIVEMARELIRLSGLEEGRDIDIVYTGLRPGEKLYEELFLGEENYVRTRHAKIFVARNQGGSLSSLNELAQMAQVGDAMGARALLSKIVPEYQPTRTEQTKLEFVVSPAAHS